MPYTDAELQAFKDSKDLPFNVIDTKSSMKTNFFVLAKNFTNLQGYLSKLKAYSVYVGNLINTETLIKSVLDAFQTNKIIVNIPNSLIIGNGINQQINTIIYQIQRVDEFIIDISNLTAPEWNTDNLIVQVKNIDGTIVYPVIITKNNKIRIHFSDGVKTNYNVFFI